VSDPADPSPPTVPPAGPSLTQPVTVAPEVLKAAFRHHAAGVAVVTADVGDGPIAMTISSLTSVSAEPAVLLFSVSSATDTGRAMARAATVVVHLLAGGDHGLAVRCATPGRDRFDDADAWERLPTGEPSFSAPRVRLRGEVVQRSVFGDSTVLVLAVLEVLQRDDPDVAGVAGVTGVAVDATSGPLAYHDRAWHALGTHSRLA
jgi:flavin reductase (DIM6/NTAB) family NADH-FMN oxidoreductase RutF